MLHALIFLMYETGFKTVNNIVCTLQESEIDV